VRTWWEDRPTVYAEELQRFADLGLEFHEDAEAKAAGRLVLRGIAPMAPGEETELIVAYPETFPLTRFSIHAPALSLPRHQGPDGGNLCVLPEGHEHWRPSYKAADFIAVEVPALIAKVRAGGEALRAAEAPQGEPFTGYLPPPTFGAVLVPEAALHLDPAVDGGSLEIRFEDERPSWVRALRLNAPATPDSFGKALLSRVWDARGNVVAEAEECSNSGFGERGRRLSGLVFGATASRLAYGSAGLWARSLSERAPARQGRWTGVRSLHSCSLRR
jgi:hypothetical protein